MSQYDNLVDAKNFTIKVLIGALGLTGVALIAALVGWGMAPQHMRVHVPPDLSRGAVQAYNEVPKPAVYSFAYYIFQQLNRWPEDGEVDYKRRIQMLSPFLTPACYENQMQEYELRKREIQGRRRAVWEIPGRGYESRRVQVTASTSWVASLDLHIEEHYAGEKVKDRLINYPMRVVSYDVDPELNPWGMALDCLVSKPTVIPIESQ